MPIWDSTTRRIKEIDYSYWLGSFELKKLSSLKILGAVVIRGDSWGIGRSLSDVSITLF